MDSWNICLPIFIYFRTYIYIRNNVSLCILIGDTCTCMLDRQKLYNPNAIAQVL